MASSTDLHHSHTVALNLQNCELSKTIFITDYSEQMFHHSNTAWLNTDSKRQGKDWSVSTLSYLAIFENLLVVRGSLPSNGVHSRLDDWQDTMGRVTCSQASCGNEEVAKHKQFTFSFFSFSFSTQKHETTH